MHYIKFKDMEKDILKSERVDDGLREFFVGIYKWMTAGVALSGLMAWLVINTNYFSFIFENKTMSYGLAGIELLLVLGVQFMINRIKPSTAGILFFLYAAITGILSSVLFVIFNLGSVITIFVATVIIYGLLAAIGYSTKRDISGWGTFLSVGMIGVIISSVINMFLHSSLMEMIISAVAVLVFAGFTVYDHQSYKKIYDLIKHNGEEVERYTVLGALHMYMNLIVMFQNLLSLFGERE